ncbi:MAG: hypothetical protein IT372_21570 [Polyangiaceae bacterium]|nr:hypothetical protein [Polyangiaceae bacterium]
MRERSFGQPAPLGDRRGAVVVMGLFMSIFLVGSLWYLIGIGDAALYRARLDAGSDAISFGAAVYHARGMNMIAMLNLILVATLAIIIVAKALKFVIGIVYATAKYMCYLAKLAGGEDPESCNVAKDAASTMEKLSLIIDSIEANEGGLMASISTAQREIAATAPWVAATESTNLGADYAPIIVSGGAVSPSMVPANGRLGLPIRDEDWAVTCKRGTDLAPDMVDDMIPPAYLEYVGMVGSLEGLTADFSPTYCGEGTFTGGDFNVFDEKDVCKEKKEKWEEEHGGHGHHGGGGEEFDWDKCIEENKVDPDKMDETEKEEKIPDVDPTEGLEEVPQPQSKTAKEIIPWARNGSDYFQVYAIVEGNTERLRAPDTGVFIAAGGAAPPITEGLEKYGLSQAEFYYDQTPDASKEDVYQKKNAGMSWPDYEPNALWNLRWRARLRYFREPTNVDVNVLGGGLVENPDVDPSYTPDQYLDVFGEAIQAGVPGKLTNYKINGLNEILNP